METEGRFDKGTVLLERDIEAPEGAPVLVLAEDPSKETTSLGQRLMRYAGILDGLPADMADNHDHYLHGHPKK